MAETGGDVKGLCRTEEEEDEEGGEGMEDKLGLVGVDMDGLVTYFGAKIQWRKGLDMAVAEICEIGEAVAEFCRVFENLVSKIGKGVGQGN
ncbi:hypothetical protein U1Q18_021018 [Sarracenia purpurea var. burkii]